MGNKLSTRIKTWWKTSTTGEKVATIVGAIGTGTSLYCAHKISKAKQDVDISHVTVTLRGKKELIEMIEARRLTVETPDIIASGRLEKDPGGPQPCSPEVAKQIDEDCEGEE